LSLILREECGLKVLKNRELRKMFGRNRGEVTGEWRKLCNEKLHNLYSSLNVIKMMKSRNIWAGYVARIGEMRNVH
jgi:hypothetical protein